MRVISGNLKGKVLNFTKSKFTRPLKDSVKENIFNIITHSKLIKVKIEKSYILDLYSGVGSFGIECVSRGAKKIYFIDKDFKAHQKLSENLKNLGIQKQTIAINDKIENYLKSINSEKFEIIFCDPPFKDKDYLNQLKNIRDRKIYKQEHLIIIHREKKSVDNFDKIIKPIIIKSYGRSKIIFGSFLI